MIPNRRKLYLFVAILLVALLTLSAIPTVTSQQLSLPKLNTTSTATTLATDNANVVKASSRVFGLGPGLFALIIIAGVFLLLTVFAAVSGYGWIALSVCTLVFAVIMGIAVAIPKVAVGQEDIQPEILDHTYHPRIAFMVLTSIFSIFGAGTAFLLWFIMPTFAVKQDDTY